MQSSHNRLVKQFSWLDILQTGAVDRDFIGSSVPTPLFYGTLQSSWFADGDVQTSRRPFALGALSWNRLHTGYWINGVLQVDDSAHGIRIATIDDMLRVRSRDEMPWFLKGQTLGSTCYGVWARGSDTGLFTAAPTTLMTCLMQELYADPKNPWDTPLDF